MLLLAPGCAHRDRPPHVLTRPPEVEDPQAPNGRRLLPASPPHEWLQGKRFPTADACQAARTAQFADAVARAREAVGDADVPLDLDVRRAVNSRCVPADTAPP